MSRRTKMLLGDFSGWLFTLWLVYILPITIWLVLFLASEVTFSTDYINGNNVWFLIPLILVNLHFTSFVDPKYRKTRLSKILINMFLFAISWAVTATLWSKIGESITWEQAFLLALASRAAVTGRHIVLLIAGQTAADQPTVTKIKKRFERRFLNERNQIYKRGFCEGFEEATKYNNRIPNKKPEEKPPILRVI